MRAIRRRLRERGQRGAVAVLVAILSTVLLVSSAFVLDLGQQRVGRADMQSLADMVALDLARELNGRSYSTLNPLMAGLAAKSEARNQSVIDYKSNLPKLTVTLGTWDDSASPRFTAVTSGIPTAVKVLANTKVGFAFGGLTGQSSGGANRIAYGTAQNEACIKVGSYAARLNSSNSVLLNAILGQALGGSLNLSLASYQGLAATDVSLADLAVQLGAGSVDQLLGTSVSLKSLYLATAAVLQKNGALAAANIINQQIANIPGAALPTIKVGDLLSAATNGSDAAATAGLNVLDLLATSAAIANGSAAIAIPTLTANLGLVSASGSLSLIQKANQGCGPVGSPKAHGATAQASVAVNGTINPINLVGIGISGSTNVTVSAASATGDLAGIVCGDGTVSNPSSDTITVKSGLLNASVSQTLHLSGNITNSSGGGLLNLGGLLTGIGNLLTSLLDPVVKVTITGDLTLSVSNMAPSTQKSVTVSWPPNTVTAGAQNWSSWVDTGSGDLGLSSLTPTLTWTTPPTVKLTGLLGDILSPTTAQLNSILANLTTALTTGVSSLATNVLSPVLSLVESSLITPLESMLGLSLGGAAVAGKLPTCGSPSLVG